MFSIISVQKLDAAILRGMKVRLSSTYLLQLKGIFLSHSNLSLIEHMNVLADKGPKGRPHQSVVGSTFLQNSELRKHKKPKLIQLFTFLNHKKTQNNSSFFRIFQLCSKSQKKQHFFFKSARVFSSLSNLSSHVDFLEFFHICANREKVKFRNLLSFFRFLHFSEKSKKVELFLNFPIHLKDILIDLPHLGKAGDRTRNLVARRQRS